MEEKIVRLGELEVNLGDLSRFLVAAKKNGYAGSDEKVRMKDGSKVYTFQDGDFHYTDIYSGSCQAPGFEVVRHRNEDGPWVWFMSYSGGMLPEFWANRELTEATYSHLKESLMLVSEDMPFRGPEHYVPPKYSYPGMGYHMKVEGNIKRFSGKEHIIQDHRGMVFSQDFAGGLVVPKIK